MIRRMYGWFLARFYHQRGIAHRYLGHLQGSQLEYRLAVVDFTQAIRHDPGLVQALYDRALVLWRELAEGTLAEQDLTQVIELDPDRSEAWFNRALARQTSGDLEGAVSDFSHYLDHGTDPMWREISQKQIEVMRALGSSSGEAGE